MACSNLLITATTACIGFLRVAPSYDPVERRTNNPQVGRDKFLRGKQKRRQEDAVLPLMGRVSASPGHFFDMGVTPHGRVRSGVEHRRAVLFSRGNERL